MHNHTHSDRHHGHHGLARIFHRNTLRAMGRRKTLAEAQETGGDSHEAEGVGIDGEDGRQMNSTGLRRSLNAFDLVLFGVGSSVGAGIFVLVGLGAKLAGPAISLSFLGCGAACILTAMAYAEFASKIPASGSAYTYCYVAFGEFAAWVIGFFLILGYGFTASVTARAWGDYTGNFLIHLLPSSSSSASPDSTYVWILQSMTEFHLFGPSVDYTCSPLSLVIIGIGTTILLRGAKDSATFNNIMTLANISMLILVVGSGIVSNSIQVENLSPFIPHGLPSVLQGAGLVFFAYLGFDQVASLSEEVIHPERNMPIGITGSLIISTLIYVAVSLSVVGMASFRYLGENVPIINALLVNACCTHAEQELTAIPEQCLNQCQNIGALRIPWMATVAHIVSGGCIWGLSASCFTSLMGQPRIFLRMAQDGLFFSMFAEIDPHTHVPSTGIKLTGLGCAILACFVPLEALANLISLGTLMVFSVVNAGVILLRLRNIHEMWTNHSTPFYKNKDYQNQMTHRVVQFLIAYFLLLLLASVLVQNASSSSWKRFLITFLVLCAIGCGQIIASLPPAWTVPTMVILSGHNDLQEHGQQTHHHHAATFNCPMVPYFPLLGLGCNTFMMGSLPLSAWIFCFVWFCCAVLVYFSYGIYHSKLGRHDRYASDAVPLLFSSKEDSRRSYDSTLNISFQEVHEAFDPQSKNCT